MVDCRRLAPLIPSCAEHSVEHEEKHGPSGFHLVEGYRSVWELDSTCRLERHKGRTSTNPALNRYGRSRSALYRADMAMGETLPNGRFTR